MDFKDEIKSYAAYTEENLLRLLPKLDNYQKNVYDAMLYSLMAGGKRIRPLLCYVTAEAVGLSKDNVADFACAVEMIHTYSLIHDDLPAMDDDDYRRGRLSNHKVFGEAQAILAGDGLLTKAFEVAGLKAASMASQSQEMGLRGARIIAEIGSAAGSEGMVGGQVIDLEAETRAVDADELLSLYALKTGKLLLIPIRIALIYAGLLGTPEGDLFEQYAKDIGLAFQIKDDILDVEGDAAVLGKATGMDEKDNKTTFVKLFGLEGAKARLAELTVSAIQCCDKLSETDGINKESAIFLRKLAVYLLERNN